MRLALAQMDCRVGDIAGNARRIVEALQAARAQRVDLIAFPELALTGYPPEDLLLRPSFVRAAADAVRDIAAAAKGVDVLVGLPWEEEGRLYNAAAWLHDGALSACYRKQILPNYGVFDERRYFVPGDEPLVRRVAGVAVGVSICEDLWVPQPAAAAAAAGARVLVNLNASPYERGKERLRVDVARRRALAHGMAVAYVNLTGAQDELVFDGASFAIGAGGALQVAGRAFGPDLVTMTCTEGVFVADAPAAVWPEGEASVYAALQCGLAGYVEKNRFDRIVLGLSGGIDSALTLALGCDAIGPSRMMPVMMPSRFTAHMSVEDAAWEARRLGVPLATIPIDTVYEAFASAVGPYWAGPGQSVAAENLQARIRGTLLMSIANAHQALVVITSNKSETAVGYATLYGDLAGGYAPLKDVLKTDIYRLAHYRNSLSEVIPERVLVRPPSAELRADQRDTDSLPPYEVLDTFLRGFVENNEEPEALVRAGLDAAVVERLVALVRGAEHKRRQAPPGTRISARAFGRDWRYPITGVYGTKM
ncbi:MAG: NAD+ synthase [Gammaproteobacteria bacterium]|nr:NAD+ synthase [Gammaproteobacteria bacterium]